MNSYWLAPEINTRGVYEPRWAQTLLERYTYNIHKWILRYEMTISWGDEKNKQSNDDFPAVGLSQDRT